MGEPLAGVRVVAVTVNVPGPAAAARLRDLGARVTFVEPPQGNLLSHAAPGWYAALTRDSDVRTLDLKQAAPRMELDRLLAQADLLITASRPSSLTRLGLGWDDLRVRCPELCHIAIVGYAPPHEEKPGHDLTYMARHGLVGGVEMPRTLMADLAGAERAATEALALLYARARTGKAGRRLVALGDAADAVAAPWVHGITRPGAYLGGGLPNYAIYPTRDGHLACALLEPQFFARFLAEVGLETADAAVLAELFLTRSAREWEDWALSRDLPLAALATQ